MYVNCALLYGLLEQSITAASYLGVSSIAAYVWANKLHSLIHFLQFCSHVFVFKDLGYLPKLFKCIITLIKAVLANGKSKA